MTMTINKKVVAYGRTIGTQYELTINTLIRKRGDVLNKHLIQVAFAGEALEDGTMDIKALAPALLALGELVEEANNLLGKQGSKVAVNVKSDFKTGSFEVAFQVVQSFLDQAIGLLPFMTDNSNLELILKSVGFLNSSGLNLLKLTKLLKGKPIKSHTVIENGLTRIETSNSFHEIKVTKEVIELYQSPRIRDNAENMVRPLELPGVEQFQVKEEGHILDYVEKNEFPYFRRETSNLAEVVSENTVEAWVEVISPVFEPERKWQVDYNGTKVYVSVLDKSFLEAVSEGQMSFSKGDMLFTKLIIRQKEDYGKIKAEHEISRVLQHKKGPSQNKLF